MGLTTEEIVEKQRQIFDDVNLYQGSDANSVNDFIRESPTGDNDQADIPDHPDQTQFTEEQVKYWTDFKANWISHNKTALDQEYSAWVGQHIAYNCSLANQG
jgi:hypothetical protein